MIALFLFAAAAARAPIDCTHPANLKAIDECAIRETDRADAALAAQLAETLAYMKQMDQQDPIAPEGHSYAETLLETQRAWVDFRDVECSMEGYEQRYGTAEATVRGNCMIALADMRTKQLRSLMWGR